MALTKISTDGVKDDAVTAGKIPANAVGSSELADNAVDNAAIANGAVGTNKLASGAVGSGEIAAGSIVNSNISSSAAIAGTKISPDFGSQNVVTTGTITSNNIEISGTLPRLSFTDSNNNPDYQVQNNDGTFIVRDTTNSADRFRVNTDGHVDIGGNLDVGADIDVTGNIDVNGSPPWSVAGGNYANISLSGNDGSSSGFIYMGSGAATTNADFDLGRINFLNNTTITSQIVGSTQTSANDDGRLAFSTKTSGGSLTERMRITSDGKVGINVNPAYQFTVQKDQANDWVSRIYNSNTSNGYGLLVRSDNTGSDAAAFSVYTNGQHKFQVNRSRSLFRASNGSQICSFDSDGIKFGTDTSSANALDDYEEGTWTPKIMRYQNGGWQDATMTDNGTVQKARYVKVGKVITCYLHWNGWQHSNANYAVMGGLPFNASANAGGFGTVNYTDAFTNHQTQGIYLNGDDSNMSFYINSNSWNGWSSSSNRNIHLGLTYITA